LTTDFSHYNVGGENTDIPKIVATYTDLTKFAEALVAIDKEIYKGTFSLLQPLQRSKPCSGVQLGVVIKCWAGTIAMLYI